MQDMLRRVCGAGAVFAAAMTIMAGGAGAADEPNLVGTWKIVDGPDGYVGVIHPNPKDPNAKPAFLKADAFYEVIIEAQQGRAFHGKAIPPSKTPVIPLVGAIRLDRQTVVISTLNGAYIGDIRGNMLDLCWFDTVSEIVQVACTVYERTAAK